MAINKVEYGSDVLIDLTADTVDKTSLLKGATAHDMKGEPITGTLDIDDVVRFQNTETDACFVPDLPLVPFVNDMLRGMLVDEKSGAKISKITIKTDENIAVHNYIIEHNLNIIPNFIYVYCDKTVDELEQISDIPSALFLFCGINNSKSAFYSYFQRSSTPTTTKLSTGTSTSNPFNSVNENTVTIKNVSANYSPELTYTAIVGYIPQLEV